MKNSVVNSTAVNEKLLNAFIENGGVLINDHTGEPEKFNAIIFFADPEIGVAGWKSGVRYQSVNRVYADKNNNLHLGTESVSGVVWGNTLTSEVLDKHNEGVIFKRRAISKAIMLDGNTINATTIANSENGD